MDKELLHKKLAETIVTKLRDENYDSYIKTKEYARSISLTQQDYINQNKPVIIKQLSNAGLRLSYILNLVFSK